METTLPPLQAIGEATRGDGFGVGWPLGAFCLSGLIICAWKTWGPSVIQRSVLDDVDKGFQATVGINPKTAYLYFNTFISRLSFIDVFFILMELTGLITDFLFFYSIRRNPLNRMEAAVSLLICCVDIALLA